MLKGDRAKQAGIVYLEDEQYDFKVKEDGRVWSVYGSPVCLNFVCFPFCFRR